MANPGYLKIVGEKQGLITSGTFTEDSVGNIYQEGHEDQILVQAANHGMSLPVDPQSGQPAGKRVHGPFTIVKTIDKCSPLLKNALASGERLTEWELKIYRTSAAGVQEHFYTISLTDAILVDYRFNLPNCQTGGSLVPTETLSFSYRKIDWTHDMCGTSGSDDWRKG